MQLKDARELDETESRAARISPNKRTARAPRYGSEVRKYLNVQHSNPKIVKLSLKFQDVRPEILKFVPDIVKSGALFEDARERTGLKAARRVSTQGLKSHRFDPDIVI